MFYDEKRTIEACTEDPSLIFNLIDEGHTDLVDKIIDKKLVDLNLTNENGDTILSYLLIKGYYDEVLKLMRKRNIDINHQNNDGETFAHILVTKPYLEVMEISKKLLNNSKFIPNIRNNKGETILDKSIKNNHIYTTVKILEDERFNNIDLISFRNLYEQYIKNSNYGIYSKVNNLEVIIDNLVEKDLLPKVEKLVNLITNNMTRIKEEVKHNELSSLDHLVYGVVEGSII